MCVFCVLFLSEFMMRRFCFSARFWSILVGLARLHARAAFGLVSVHTGGPDL